MTTAATQTMLLPMAVLLVGVAAAAVMNRTGGIARRPNTPAAPQPAAD